MSVEANTYDYRCSQRQRGGPLKQRINHYLTVYSFEKPGIPGVQVAGINRNFVDPKLPKGWAVVMPRDKRGRKSVISKIEKAGYREVVV